MRTALHPSLGPLDFHAWTGLEVPDPITFVLSPRWLNRPQLYPRQATLLKIIFLRNDLLTEYDHAVIDEWERSFRHTGDNGIVSGIRSRMEYLRSQGYRHFREVLLVLGRRAGKGYVSALAMAYVLWGFLAKGDPQEHYGVDRDKQLACFVYAGKKEQARENLWKDLVNVIQGATCFARYVHRPLGESLSVYAPHDFVRMKKLRDRGVYTDRDMASFLIQPKEATLMSGRGPAACMLAFDEMAHVVASSGSARSAGEVYGSAVPALDQFKKDSFIIDPSSPWQQVGQFYENWQMCLAVDERGEPEHPYMMMLQLTSWDMYLDWEDAHLLPLFPEGHEGDLGEYAEGSYPALAPLRGAIQEYDERMAALERANPDTFAVERRSRWQSVVDAYLDPAKIAAMFDHSLEMTAHARNLTTFYKGAADPSIVNDHFAVAIGHAEEHEDGYLRCVFDYIHHWEPAEFDNHTIDYLFVTDRLFELVRDFGTDEFTFDAHNSAMPIQELRRRLRELRIPKRIEIFEKTPTAQTNWDRAECFKACLNQGWVVSPYYETAELELKFLQLKNGNKVVHQDTGPVTHDDVATVMMEVVWTILGRQADALIHGALGDFKLAPMVPGGVNPYRRQEVPEDVLSRLSPRRGAVVRAGGFNPARNPHRRGR